MKKLVQFLFLFSICSSLYAKSDFYKKVFPNFTSVKNLKIEDPISDNPINTTLIQVIKDKSIQGYIREISTTTGCDSACLPVIYTSFYDNNGNFLKVLSRDGLTKINHTPFSKEDYSKLEFLVTMAPKEFDKITHPKELTDAISGATIKKYKDIVVPGAAYSTLRIHLYNQHTLKEIQKLK